MITLIKAMLRDCRETLSDLSEPKLMSGHNPLRAVWIAEVTVTTGFWRWKKSTRRKIYRPALAHWWRYFDNGGHTPGDQAERLEAEHLNRARRERLVQVLTGTEDNVVPFQ